LAVVHEVAGLTYTAQPIEIGIGRTRGNYFTASHQILTPLGTHASRIGITVHLVSAANGYAYHHAHSLAIPTVATSADAFQTVVELVTAALQALAIDHVVTLVADAETVVVVGIGAAVEVDT
jgi:hypothetical protein